MIIYNLAFELIQILEHVFHLNSRIQTNILLFILQNIIKQFDQLHLHDFIIIDDNTLSFFLTQNLKKYHVYFSYFLAFLFIACMLSHFACLSVLICIDLCFFVFSLLFKTWCRVDLSFLPLCFLLVFVTFVILVMLVLLHFLFMSAYAA